MSPAVIGRIGLKVKFFQITPEINEFLENSDKTK